MKLRQAKKIYKKYGRWYPVPDDFASPEGMTVEYFTTGSAEWNAELHGKKIGYFGIGSNVYGMNHKDPSCGVFIGG